MVDLADPIPSERFIPRNNVIEHVTPAHGTGPSRDGDIVPATSKDVRAIIRLVEEAGWAYTRTEVERLIAVQPDGMLLKRSPGFRHELLGCVYASVWGRLGFIGLMLVKESHRGNGMGRELMAAGLEYIRSHGITTVGLDSVGNAVSFYSKLGFRAEWTSLRFGIETAKFDMPEAPPEVRKGSDQDLSRAIELDKRMSGLDRETLLRRLHADGDSTLMVVPSEKAVLAFGVLRRSKGCLRLGPLVSVQSEEGALAARAVITAAIQETYPRMMTLNVPEYNVAMVELMVSMGAVSYAPCTRMYQGDPGRARRPEGSWALGAAEKG
jgi:GNAT superfamily N-acetyltransferase